MNRFVKWNDRNAVNPDIINTIISLIVNPKKTVLRILFMSFVNCMYNFDHFL
ncbi:hypothetical protein [Porcipelethomonas sp.]|uniref:hypothetical protein n=1 Tax=Porcipelethomonas sp. TaxID=2981675 RepID=UPI00301FA718